ncbi:MAG: hypothetical protein OEM84_07405 [Acidimicrobiia bacterium]|nr:hypothetical protein [Acidimicrobiia bacterium]MDH5616731.1 hypothetical protein [Acidimicrobiia bacterium]
MIAVTAGGVALASQGDDDGPNIGDATAVQVRVGPAFSGYGLESGDPIANARITVLAGGEPNGIVLFEGVTDQDGRLALLAEPGQYLIIAEAETTDPMCWWYGGDSDVELSQDTGVLITVDAGLMCE